MFQHDDRVGPLASGTSGSSGPAGMAGLGIVLIGARRKPHRQLAARSARRRCDPLPGVGVGAEPNDRARGGLSLSGGPALHPRWPPGATGACCRIARCVRTGRIHRVDVPADASGPSTATTGSPTAASLAVRPRCRDRDSGLGRGRSRAPSSDGSAFRTAIRRPAVGARCLHRLAELAIVSRYLPALFAGLEGNPLLPSSAKTSACIGRSCCWIWNRGPGTVAAAVALIRGTGWGSKALYAVLGWFALVPPSVAAMAVVMVVKDDPNASIGQTIVLTCVAAVFAALAVRPYRLLFGRHEDEAKAVW